MSNHYHTQEKPLVFSASCLLITAKELREDTRNRQSLKKYCTSVLLTLLGISSVPLG